jgi:hypothetical protein
MSTTEKYKNRKIYSFSAISKKAAVPDKDW